MDESVAFSSGIDGLLACLRGTEESGQRAFPIAADRATLRMVEGEGAHSWFVRCVDKFMDGGKELPRWRIEEDLAVFALVEWSKPDRRLRACSINVLKAEGTLEDYYADSTIGAYYLRMDYDYGTLGPMFTHPLPHVHVWTTDAAPRFVAEGTSRNVVVDFLEWVYRHFYKDTWQCWAFCVCQGDFAERYEPDKNPLERIFAAFQESQMTTLREWAWEIQRIKSLLRARKDEVYDILACAADRELLQYP